MASIHGEIDWSCGQTAWNACIVRVIANAFESFSFPIRAVIGEVDEEMDAEMNLADIRAEPLNPVLH